MCLHCLSVPDVQCCHAGHKGQPMKSASGCATQAHTPAVSKDPPQAFSSMSSNADEPRQARIMRLLFKNQPMIVRQPVVDACAIAGRGPVQQASADGSSGQQEEDVRQEVNEVGCLAGTCSSTCCTSVANGIHDGLACSHNNVIDCVRPCHCLHSMCSTLKILDKSTWQVRGSSADQGCL